MRAGDEARESRSRWRFTARGDLHRAVSPGEGPPAAAQVRTLFAVKSLSRSSACNS